MKKRIVYVVLCNRVSSKKQARINNGSLQQQLHITERYLDKLRRDNPQIEYVVIEIINEDLSGKRESLHKRKDLLRILDLIALGKVQHVIFEKVDRISRDQVFNLQLIHLANEHGCTIHEAIDGPIDFSDRSRRMGFNLKNMLAEEYTLDLSDKKRRKNREAMVNSGKDVSTNVVLGLDPHPSKACMYVHNGREVKQVLDIVQKFIETCSIKKTLLYCNEMNYKTKLKQTKEKNDKDGNKCPGRKMGGDKFTNKSLITLLTSAKLRGFGQFEDDLNQFPEQQDEDGYVTWKYAHEPVIGNAQSTKIDEILDKNKKFKPSRSDNHLLAGILQSEGSDFFVGDSSKKSDRDYFYYFLKNADKGSAIRRISAEILHREIIDKRLKQMLSESIVLQKMTDDHNEIKESASKSVEREMKAVKARISDLEGKQARFSERVSELVLSDMPEIADAISLLKVESDKNEVQLKKAYSSLETLDAKFQGLCDKVDPSILKDKMKLILKGFDELDNCDKKSIIQKIFPKIVVFESGRVEIYVNPELGVGFPTRHGGVGSSTERKWRERVDEFRTICRKPLQR